MLKSLSRKLITLKAFIGIAVNAFCQGALSVQLVPQFYGGGYNIHCNGGSDGKINSQVTGGTSSYTYSWSNGATTANLQNAHAGAHTLTVTDAANVSANSSVILYCPHMLTINPDKRVYGDFNVSAQVVADGYLHLEVIGGVHPSTYVWCNGNHTSRMGDLLAGTKNLEKTEEVLLYIIDLEKRLKVAEVEIARLKSIAS